MRAWIAGWLSAAVALWAPCAPAGRGSVEDPMPGALRVTTDRATYRPGDTLMVTLTLTNAGPDTARWRFSTGQRYDVAILAADGAPVWRWGAERMFMQMLGEEWLAPGDSLVYREPAPAPSGPGRYTVEGRIPALDAPLAARVEVIVEG